MGTEEKSANSEKKEVIPSEDISVSKNAQASESKEAEKEEAQTQLKNEDLKKKDLNSETVDEMQPENEQELKQEDEQKTEELKDTDMNNDDKQEDLKEEDITNVETSKAMSPEPSKNEILQTKASDDVKDTKTDEKETAENNEENESKEIKHLPTQESSEEPKCEGKMTEEEVKEMVEKVEGKCKNIRGDIADMAMSEQYLRTKQALLMAKKKEQEMKIAQKNGLYQRNRSSKDEREG